MNWKTTVFSEKLLNVLKYFCTSGNILVLIRYIFLCKIGSGTSTSVRHCVA